MHVNMRPIHPGLKKKKKEFRLDSNDCSFICVGVNFVGSYKWHPLFYLRLFVANLLLFEHHQQQKCSLADSFLDPMA